MKESSNDNSTIIELEYDKREDTLLRELNKVLNERSVGLTGSAALGTLYILIDKFKKDEGII